MLVAGAVARTAARQLPRTRDRLVQTRQAAGIARARVGAPKGLLPRQQPAQLFDRTFIGGRGARKLRFRLFKQGIGRRLAGGDQNSVGEGRGRGQRDQGRAASQPRRPRPGQRQRQRARQRTERERSPAQEGPASPLLPRQRPFDGGPQRRRRLGRSSCARRATRSAELQLGRRAAAGQPARCARTDLGSARRRIAVEERRQPFEDVDGSPAGRSAFRVIQVTLLQRRRR